MRQTLMGSKTAIARGAVRLSSVRTQVSSMEGCITTLLSVTPTCWQKLLMALGGKPRRLKSQPGGSAREMRQRSRFQRDAYTREER